MSEIAVGLDSGDQPPKSEIVIKIDYSEDDSSPARVFERAAGLIRCMEEMDAVFVQSIGSHIETAFILEDLQRSSIKVFLRNVLKQVDDDALKDLDWKKQVGAYLVKAKYAAIKWLDDQDKEDCPRQLRDLTEEIARLARNTDVRRLPDYPEPNKTRLAQTLDHFQEEKSKFRESDRLTITLDKSEYTVNLGSTWLPSEHVPPEEHVKELSNEMDMFLIIRKPDFLGSTQWQFRHGKSYLSMPIEDTAWLERFHKGDFPLRPGDALRVRVRSTYTYDDSGNLKTSDMVIVKVFEVKPMGGQTRDFWD